MRGFVNHMRGFYAVPIAVFSPSSGLDFNESRALKLANIVLDCPLSEARSLAQSSYRRVAIPIVVSVIREGQHD